MEPVTHLLFGATLARAGLNRKTALATATLTLAAEAPDLDVLGRFHGSVFGFEHHRGFTHSFLGAFVVAGLILAFMYGVYLLRRKKYEARYEKLPPRWGLLFAGAYLASLSHILLDFTNNYGVRPFWPFSGQWYSWDIVFIIEPVLLVLLIAGLALPGLFSLINEEIGLRSSGPPGRVAARAALIGVVLLWGVRDYEHRVAVAALEAQTYQGSVPLRVAAYPYMANPFKWYGIAETDHAYAQMLVNSLTPEVDPEGKMTLRAKPDETPVTQAAKQTPLGRAYLDWAKFPVTEVESSQPEGGHVEGGYLVRFLDLRYDYFDRRGGRTALGAAVVLDPQLRTVRELFGRAGR